MVLEFNGQRVEGTEQFVRVVRETPAGRTVKMLVHRGGASMTLPATIAARKMKGITTSMAPLEGMHIEMPRIDGFELCRRLRLLPGYQQTPVIYVTAHDDFEHRAKSALSGGDDFISKPVLSMELAVKALTQLVKRQLGL